MIDPRSQYIIYQEQENGRMLQIERKLAAQARGGCKESEQPRHFSAEKWLKVNVFSRVTGKGRHSTVECPC
jgi:hypothetical protein